MQRNCCESFCIVKKISGYSLIELLIATAIFSFGLLMLARMQLVAQQTVQHTLWLNLAENQLQFISESLLVDKKNYQNQIAAWQQETAWLLPQGEARLTGVNPFEV